MIVSCDKIVASTLSKVDWNARMNESTSDKVLRFLLETNQVIVFVLTMNETRN